MIIVRKEKMKQIGGVLLVLVLMLSLIGCNSAAADPTGTSAATTAATGTAEATDPAKETEPAKETKPAAAEPTDKTGATTETTAPQASGADNVSSILGGSAGNGTSGGSGSTPAATQPAHSHSYTKGNTVAATCTDAGYTVYTCSCGSSYNDNWTSAVGHSWGDWVTTSEATYDAEGKQTRTCSICGGTEDQSIPKLEAEAIDTYALAQYGVSYGTSSYGFTYVPGVRAGYYPGYTCIINSMEEGYSEVASCVAATGESLLAAFGSLEGASLDVVVEHAGGNRYTVWVYYG